MPLESLFTLIILSVVIVTIILAIGIGGFARGGPFNRKYGNKLMRLRLLAQFFAVVLILAYVLFHSMG
ncbi:MAG: twin transmembrane helix small protein [Aestuariivita sp.]|nr:twin transmembrane helix small protein [Aestuariivita sp.]